MIQLDPTDQIDSSDEKAAFRPRRSDRRSRLPSHKQATIAIALLSVIALQSCTDLVDMAATWLGYAPQELTDPDAMHNAIHHEDPERRRTALRELQRRNREFLRTAEQAAAHDPDEGVRSTAAGVLRNTHKAAGRALNRADQPSESPISTMPPSGGAAPLSSETK